MTVAESRALDARAVRELGMPSILLMENAARGVADAARGLGASWMILCGPGNNGGDGLAAARHLGRAARVHLLAAPEPSRCPDAALQLRILRNAGVPVHSEAPDPDRVPAGTVWIDALYGTGLVRPLDGAAARWVDLFNRAVGPKLCVDVPSGLHGDSGEALGGIACRGDVTVTFHAAKQGLLVATARPYVGRVIVAPLGIPL